MNNKNKKIFWTSPYKVGASRARSLALVIPAQIVKDHNIDTSTIFIVKPQEKKIILEKINFSEKMRSDQSLAVSSQQKSTTPIT